MEYESMMDWEIDEYMAELSKRRMEAEENGEEYIEDDRYDGLSNTERNL